MNKKTKKTINRLLRKFGFRLVKVQSKAKFKTRQVHDPQYSYMEDPALQEKLHQELAQAADNFFSNELPDLVPPGYCTPDRVGQFFRIWAGRPYYDNTGGSGFHNAFWLYLLTSGLQPDLIVESGIWKGHTSWLLKQASPQANFNGFDINLKRLEFNHPEASFYEQDWEGFKFPSLDPEKSLVFFDCHVNHALRILEAKRKGFRHLVFDDNPPLHKIYSYGQPGYPTAHMLWDGDLPAGEPVHWLWKDKPHQISLDLDQAQQARKLIKQHLVFPDVGGPTRYGGFSFLTYIEI